MNNFNKIFGSLLLVVIIVFGINKTSDIIYKVNVPTTESYKVEVKDNSQTTPKRINDFHLSYVFAKNDITDFRAGLGFNYGSFNLDMVLTNVDAMLNDPVKYVTGRNGDEPGQTLGSHWTITYNW